MNSPSLPVISRSKPQSLMLGLDHLWQIRKDQLTFYKKLQLQHGDAVQLRLGPHRSWLLFHPQHIHGVMVENAKSFVRFEPLMRVLAQWNGSSLLIAEGTAWQAQRRMVLPGFAPSRMSQYASHIVRGAVALRDIWSARAPMGEQTTLDVDAAMVSLTLDLAAFTLFDSELGESRAAIARAVESLSEIAFEEASQIFPTPSFIPTQHQRKKRAAIATMRHCVRKIVMERRGTPDCGDVLSGLMAQGEMDEAGLCDEVMTLLIAGHETTSAALTWIIYLLATNSHALRCLQRELTHILEGRIPTLNDLSKLPYLEAVIKESLRLYPPAYSLFLRRAIHSVQLNGVQLRKGDLVQIVPYITQRDERWFVDPDCFTPERFLQASVSWPRHAFLPFGVGPRVCVGQSFGMMEMSLITATLLQTLTPSFKGPPPILRARFSLRPMGGMSISWSSRQYLDR
ncbi:MAG: hypothetical protein CFE44_17655 [Burkholderiales bacterium PBB4]|nr:MAG: hypothetical protein CFE44_17655 [Burkholderiales bacterium PBB4]